MPIKKVCIVLWVLECGCVGTDVHHFTLCTTDVDFILIYGVTGPGLSTGGLGFFENYLGRGYFFFRKTVLIGGEDFFQIKNGVKTFYQANFS